MEWVTMVTTAPRPGRPLLGRCLTSLDLAGFRPPVIFAEPGSPIPLGCVVRQAADRLGPWRNWLFGLQQILREKPRADAVMTVQDDVEFCRGARPIAERCLWPSDDCGLVQLCTSAAYAAYPGPLDRLAMHDAHQLRGAWACVFPRHVAQVLVATGLTRGWRGTAWPDQAAPDAHKECIDLFIGETLVRMRRSVWIVRPSLARHDAEFSAIDAGDHGASDLGARRTLDYAGNQGVGEPGKAFKSVATRPLLRNGHLLVVIPFAGVRLDAMQETLESLRMNCSQPMHLVLIDNGSPRAFAARVIEQAEGIDSGLHYRRFRRNRGFTAAVNRALAYVLSNPTFEMCGWNVLLLNSDCSVAPGCIDWLADTLAAHPDAAAVGPLTIDQGRQSMLRPERFIQAGLSAPPSPYRGSQQWERFFAECEPREETLLSFFCVLIRREALRRVGLLDPEYADGLCADDDWCDRARRQGWKLYTQPAAFAAHEHGATFEALGLDRAAMQWEANQRRKAEKRMPQPPSPPGFIEPIYPL